MTKQIKAFSMFDGVGGFIVGLNGANKEIGQEVFVTTHSNQYEPSRKSQDAFEVGVYNFSEIEHSNENIMNVPNSYFEGLKQADVELILGGFPCQDYSVARSKKNEMGIAGVKGVLFWEIIRAVIHIEPKYLILENVDRLLKSPSNQRGRDMAVMLAAFNQLGYSVEWRVINAADYGRAQRRRRVFFFIYRNDTEMAKKFDDLYGIPSQEDNPFQDHSYDDYIFYTGLFGRQFPVEPIPNKSRYYSQVLSQYDSQDEERYIPDVSDNFVGEIWNAGVMRHGKYFTIDTTPLKEEPIPLGEIVKRAQECESVNEKYFITDKERIKKFEYLRGAKRIERKTAEGHSWTYTEGGMSPYDNYDLPARTMLTSEGTLNRSTHLLKDGERYRLLTPIEAELLQDFPPNWTKYKKTSDGKIEEVSDRMRMFFMGNALVTGIVKRIGIELNEMIEEMD